MVLYESKGVQPWKELTAPEETGPRHEVQCTKSQLPDLEQVGSPL